MELEPATVERVDLRLERGLIVARGEALVAQPGDEVIDLTGRLIVPGLVDAHHHLVAGVLRGQVETQKGFDGYLSRVASFEDELSADDVAAFTAAGALEALACGTTTVIAMQASPGCPGAGLERAAQALGKVGLRAVLAGEVSDRAGAVAREEGLEAIGALADHAQGRLRAAVGVSHLGALSDEALAGIKTLCTERGLPFVATLAEDREEERQSQSRFEATPLDRLEAQGLIGPKAVLAQGVHLSWPDLSRLVGTGAWMVHAARSNMATQTGGATPLKFGVRATLGTDGQAADLYAEGQVAWLRSRDAAMPIDLLRFFANGQRLASELFGLTIGPLQPGAVADLVVMDYQPVAPLDAASLHGHVAQGLGARHVESVMVDGLWRLWKRHPLAVDGAQVRAHAAEAGKALWARLPVDLGGEE